MVNTASFPVWSHSTTTRWCHRIGIAALLLYMFTWVLSLDVSRSLEPLLMLTYLIALLVQPQRLQSFRDPLWLLFGLWLALQLITLPPAMAMFPDYAEDQIKSMRGLSKVFLILPIAWLMAGSTRIALWTLSALIVGMMVGSMLTGESPATLAHYIEAGTRPTLGFKNWQHAGVCAGVILIAQACFGWRFFIQTDDWSPWQRWLTRALFVLVAFWALTAWAITMTRSAWLGIGVVSLVALAGLLVLLAKGHLNSATAKKRIAWALTLSVLAILLMGLLFGSQVVSRILVEHNVLLEILDGDLSNVPPSSIGFRIHAWHYALQLIAEQPWFGWGPKSHIPLLLQSTNPVESTTLGAISARHNLTHFHSSYFTVLVANGITGFTVFLATVVTIGVSAYRSWRRGDMPSDVMIFLSLFFIFWAIVNLFESYMAYRTGVYVIGAVGGMAYTYSMRRRLGHHIQWQNQH
ncbi:O-antigen ligase family protein [Kushneria indalinina]|uniref:O-antigen ligase-like membrane protein n=1 Tax=Kushneria indalinina DSM 14324 TaxID=1122140 RepID=A0A3D9DU41_9GAMM|nr:O-antigen ligase family protein [Kushneria indalinina]REC94276.1 O-antigen ligase-like membrane protein [Kushneria indalinina DSM 14324]